jgi:hypothetical protein
MNWNFIIFSLVKIAIAIGVVQGIGHVFRAGRAQDFRVDSGPRGAEPHGTAVRKIYSRWSDPFLTRLGFFSRWRTG